MARKGCSIVLHTRVEARMDHVWLKCRSNQDRGALVDALVRWHESSTPELPELNVQQASIASKTHTHESFEKFDKKIPLLQ